MLIQVDEIGNDQSGRTESRVSGCNRSSDYAQNSEDTSQSAHPIAARFRHDLWSLESQVGRIVMIEISGSGSPNQSYDTFRDHGSIEDRTTVTFVLDATRHQRTLRGMESGNGTTGNGDEQTGENRIFVRIGMRIAQTIPKLRKSRMIDKEHHDQTHSHEQQCECKDGIDLTDNLIDRQQSGYHIIDEDHDDPEHQTERIGRHLRQQHGRTGDEHGTYENQQDHAEDQHYPFHVGSEITANQLRKTFPFVADRKHARQIIVHSTSKDTSEDDPEERRDTEERPHDGAEDRSCASDIEELYHIHFPRRHRDIINAVLHGVGRRFSRSIYFKDPFY